MPKVINDEQTVYTYEELDNRAKKEVVRRYVEETYDTEDSNGETKAGEELEKIAEELLSASVFKHAKYTGLTYNLSFTNNSALFFSYDTDNFCKDFPDIGKALVEKLTDQSLRNSNRLLAEEVNELINKLLYKSIDELYDIKFDVVPSDGSNYAEYMTEYEVHSYLDQNLKDYAEDLLKDYIYRDMLLDNWLVTKVEAEFESKVHAYNTLLKNEDNYSNSDFKDCWYYKDGTFAGYSADLNI